MSEKFKKVLAKAQKNFDDMFGCSQCASLRAENEKRKKIGELTGIAIQELETQLAEAIEILTLIAAPRTYNRCREACEELARKFLEKTK